MERTLKISLTVVVVIILSLSLTQCIEEPTAPPLTAVGGVVKDGNGALIEGANVKLSDKVAVTNAKGVYYIDDISSGSYTIKISKNNYAEAEKIIVITTGMVISEELTIIRLGGIVGEVTNADGNGEEGVKITTTPTTIELLTDANGSYSLLDLTAGSYVVKAEKEKFATITKPVIVTDGEMSNGDISVLTLGGIFGQVTDVNSNPVEGVKITTTPATEEVITDVNGNYSLLDLTAGSYVVKGEKEKLATFTKSVTVVDGQISNGDLSVLTLGGIFGIVTDVNSNPLEGVKITTTPSTVEIFTDANGSYSLLDLSAGDYTIEAEKSKYKNKTKSVTVTNGQLSNGDISILRLGGISGKVTDADSNPVEGVKISTTPATVDLFTDTNGNYNLIDLIAGSYVIKAEKEKFSTFTKSVTVEDGKTTNGNISISTLGGISGKVTDGDSSPLEGVRITTAPATTEVLTDVNGNYSLLDLIAGSYTIQAEKTGYVNKTKAVEVIDGQISNGDIYISILGGISGRVTDESSNPLFEVRITTTPATSDVLTDADGNYSLLDLAAGSYAVKAEMGSYGGVIQVTVTDGEISNGDISLSFTCGTYTVLYSGKTYHTVQIGDQCWLKENLDVGTMVIDSTDMFYQTDNNVTEKYCYNNDPANCTIYGGLYEWPEAMQYARATVIGSQGICPDGWHIPIVPEYFSLEEYVNGEGVKLMDESQTRDGYIATNESGFSGLFAGFMMRDPTEFIELGFATGFWASDSNMQTDDITHNMMFLDPHGNIGVEPWTGFQSFSVRCIKD